MKFSTILVYAPFAVFALSLFVFVCRCGFRPLAKIAWMLWLLLALSKFWCFRTFGGSAFYPDFPQALIIGWDVAYSGAVVLTLLSAVFFFRFRFKALTLALASWTVAAVGVWNGVSVPRVHEMDLEFPQLPDSLDGYRIVQISDLHCSGAARRWRTEAVVEMANAQRADLICLTGDYVDGYVADRSDDMAPLKNLRAADGVYYVRGNHEYYRDRKKWMEWYRENGMRFLVNECVFPRPGLALGGVNDSVARSYRDVKPDVQKAFAAATNGQFRLLLEHRPECAVTNLCQYGVDLQLSGHTHGGVAPIIRQIVSKHNAGYSHGVYRFGERMLYVSPGAGQWAGFPVRFCNPSEIALIRLVKAKRKSERD
ncbi:MAG: metallophosphoesterase [Clostridia bacterium]|nr:metallophosphoesterase [Clostridia bacterium]